MYRLLPRGRTRAISPSAAVAGAATPDRRAQRVLIVEDSDCLRAVAVRILTAGGYAVAEARHGEDALRVIEQTAEPFDLVVTEMIMPVMSGYKLGRRLARQHPGLPVLYMSASVNRTLVSPGPASDGTHILQKPFRPEDLVRQVTESLRAPPGLDPGLSDDQRLPLEGRTPEQSTSYSAL